MIQELLVNQLRDILHAEKQVEKALPKMVKAAHSQQLQQVFETHLEETEVQIERLEECFGLLDIQPRKSGGTHACDRLITGTALAEALPAASRRGNF